MLPTSPLAAIRWLPLVNQSSSTIPAFACLRVVGTALDATGQLIYSVDQPNGDASANYLFNGPSAIAAGAGGSGTLDFPCQATWDTGTPAAGDLWGPKSGQWTLTKQGLPGFPVLGIVDSGTGRMLIGSPSSPAAIIVKPAYDIAAISSATPGSGSGEVYTFNGTTLSDAIQTVTVYNLSTQTAKAGTFYECLFVGGYAFIVNPGGSATLFEATIYGTDLTSTATTGEVTPTTAIWGSLPDPDTYPITVQNDFNLQGPIGRTCLVAQADSGTYYLIQIKPPSDVLFEGTLVGTLASTDATTSVNVTGPAIYGGLPGGGGGVITANNDFGMSGSAAQLVLVAEDILGNYYLIPTTSTPLPILFWTTLYSNLLASSTTANCNAGVTQIFGTMAAAGFTAANTLGLSGKSGTKCLVAGDATVVAGVPAPNYYLLEVMPGGGCTFTLQTGDLAGGSASATVGTPWGKAPDSAAATITVKDPQGLFARALGSVSGTAAAKGEAIYDPVQGYVVVACDQETLRYKAQLAGTLAYSDATGSVSSLAAMNAKPFGQTRTGSITPNNPLSLAGPNGANCYLEWDQSADDGAGAWELTGVQNYKQTVLTAEQFSGGNLQIQTRDAVAMWNAAATGWSTILSASSATVVVGVQFSSGTLSYTTNTVNVLGTGTAASPTTLFTTINVDPVTDLQYASYPANPDNALQVNTCPLIAINPTYTASKLGVKSGFVDEIVLVEADPITAVALSGGGALTQQYTPIFVFGKGTQSAAASAGAISTTTVTVVVGDQFAGGALQNQTNTLTVLNVGTASGWNNIFTTVSLDPVTSLQYANTPYHAFQSKGTPITAIDPSYTATGAGTPDADWATWFTAVKADPLTAVALSGVGALTQTTTDIYLMEVSSPNAATSAGSLSTTTETVYTALSYSGGLAYVTKTLTILGSVAAGSGNIFTTSSVAAVTSLAYTGNQLIPTTTSFDAINAGTPTAGSAVFTAVSQQVVSSVGYTDPTFSQTFYNVYVFSTTAGSTSTVFTAEDDCPGG